MGAPVTTSRAHEPGLPLFASEGKGPADAATEQSRNGGISG